MNKIKKVMHEYKEGELHSGSKKGPEVKKRSQAVAIALSEAKKEGKKKYTQAMRDKQADREFDLALKQRQDRKNPKWD